MRGHFGRGRDKRGFGGRGERHGFTEGHRDGRGEMMGRLLGHGDLRYVILSLIEETSGTALFEKRKEECLKMLEKKELTLRSISETIETQIQPMRAKIVESRENTRKFEDNEKKIDELTHEIVYDDY